MNKQESRRMERRMDGKVMKRDKGRRRDWRIDRREDAGNERRSTKDGRPEGM